jgi:hypothetical protein
MADTSNKEADREAAPLVGKIRRKFEKLEKICQDRYQARESRILDTLNYCMAALDQLHSWSLFAIFPLDEAHADQYLGFVDHRYKKVIDPMRKFRSVIREQTNSGNFNSQSDVLNLDQGYAGSEDSTSLRTYVSDLTQTYHKEADAIKVLVQNKLNQSRKDLRTVFRWGQASLMDLHDVLDESLADELYFMVRGKMARILSGISALEDISEQIDRNLSLCLQQRGENQGLASSSRMSSSPSPRRDYSGDRPKDRPNDRPGPPQYSGYSPADFRIPVGSPRPGSPQEDAPVRDSRDSMDSFQANRDALIDSFQSNRGEPLMESYQSSRGDSLMDSYRSTDEETPRRRKSDRPTGLMNSFDWHPPQTPLDSDSVDNRGPSNSSSPEPPNSPRPKGLASHPKILKDKMHKYLLPQRMTTTW